MKIIRVDLQKAKNDVKNKIKGYPRVERGNISLFSFCKQFWNIPTPLWFSKNPPRELHGQNIFTRTTRCLQIIIPEIRRGSTNTKEISSSQKLTSIVSRPIREKPEVLVTHYWIKTFPEAEVPINILSLIDLPISAEMYMELVDPKNLDKRKKVG